jgi:hypothetical protein
MTTTDIPRRAAAIALAAAALAGLAGCAGLNVLSVEVSSFGEWPQGRAPGTYAFERLPSQQARAAETERLEAAARPALERAGFRPAAEGGEADVLVQVGARVSRVGPTVWDDPFWYGGAWGPWGPWRPGTSRWGPWPGSGWVGPGWGWGYGWPPPPPFYEREVAVLIRDRASGKPLFEARGATEGTSSSDLAMFAAMFDAALVDFPKTGVNPRTVTVPFSR